MVILYYPQNTAPGMGRLPLSLLALGAVLEGRFDYCIVDGNVNRSALSKLTEIIQSHPGKAVLCVSVMPGTQLVNAIRDTKALKSRFPWVSVIWGGYFPSMHSESVLNSPYVDYVIRGQAEKALPELLEALIGGASLKSIHNLSHLRGGKIERNAEYPIFDPNDRPFFPYGRLDMDRYAMQTFIGKRTYCHETSVGCPHKCNFCGVVDLFHSRWKGENPERIMEFIRYLKKHHGMDGIEFHDSEMFVSESRVSGLCELMKDENISWWSEGRIDTMLNYSRDTWKLMQQSGLKMIFFGAESGLNDTLKLMDKGGVTREKTKEIAALCKQFNVKSEFSFVMGSNPERTEEDIDATISLIYELEEINPNSQMHPFIYTPVPFGTIYDKAVEGGLTYPKNLDEWASHEWRQYALRRNPHTSWLTPRLYNKIVNFRAVHQAYYPKTNDRIIARWKVSLLKVFSTWRYKLRVFRGAYELRFLLRVLINPSPKHEGF